MSAVPVSRTWNAERDLDAIWSHVAKDSRRAADALIRRLDRSSNSLPGCLVLVSQPQLGDLVRRVVDKYLVFYEARPDAIEIVRVIHSARRWEDLL